MSRNKHRHCRRLSWSCPVLSFGRMAQATTRHPALESPHNGTNIHRPLARIPRAHYKHAPKQKHLLYQQHFTRRLHEAHTCIHTSSQTMCSATDM